MSLIKPCDFKKPLVANDVDNQKKSASSSLSPMLFGEATRKGVTDSNDATGKTKVVFLFSKHLGPRRFAETRVVGNPALKSDEIAQEKGPGELVRPQSTSTQCPSMRERRSHTQCT